MTTVPTLAELLNSLKDSLMPDYTDFHLRTEQMVKEWNTAFGNLDAPVELWEKLNREELAEFLKEAVDLIWVGRGLQLAREHNDEFESANATCDDIDEFAETLIGFIGEDIVNDCFEEVFRSNMSKLVDGKPLRREDGKILKGPNYSPANITAIVERYFG